MVLDIFPLLMCLWKTGVTKKRITEVQTGPLESAVFYEMDRVSL